MHKSPLAALILFSGTLLTGSAAFAASDYYLKIGDIKGEPADGAGSPLEASSFSWGASQGTSAGAPSGTAAGKVSMQDLSVMKSAAPRDAASGMPTGKRQHKPLPLAMDGGNDAGPPLDSAGAMRSMSLVVPGPGNATSRQLDQACASGQHIDKAVLGVRGQMFAMNDVVVSSCTSSGTERTYEFRGHVTLMK